MRGELHTFAGVCNDVKGLVWSGVVGDGFVVLGRSGQNDLCPCWILLSATTSEEYPSTEQGRDNPEAEHERQKSQ